MSNLEKLRTLIPIHELEPGCQQQIYAALELDFLKTLAIMPDAHKGYLLCIGGAALLDNVVCPEYVGSDQMCGMLGRIYNSINAEDVLKGHRQAIFKAIHDKIPVGRECREQPYDYPEFRSALGNKELDKRVNEKLRIQVGTLGSGNHFLEIGFNLAGNLSVVIHSGSRKPGYTLADYWMKFAKTVDTHLPGPFLDASGDFGKAFLKDLSFMEEYALTNRAVMMEDVTKIMSLEHEDYFGINEHHNSAEITEEGILHRKGATPAYKDQYGVIPGNMRDGTYITIGLGNEEFLCSASHGAGRTMGRNDAKRTLSLEKFQADMIKADVVARVDKDSLDESGDAYKDLVEVIRLQRGVVINDIDYLTPRIVVKG